MTSRKSLRFAPPLVALGLAACAAVGPDFEPPETAVPDGWHEESARPESATAPAEGSATPLVTRAADVESWWRQLKDPVLDGLVERAAQQGLDLREALFRVREARALRGAAAGEQYPRLDATASYRRSGESKNTPLGEFVPVTGIYSAGLEASWEADLWGRVRRSVEAADADLEAKLEDARDVAVTVAADTALAYVELRAFQRRVAIARTNVELQEQTLALVRARFESGLVGERDVAQAETNVATTRSRVPAFEAGVRTAQNRLAVLVGQAPGALASELDESQPIPVAPIEVAVGVPADLLRRRPDVRRAERVLTAETARIGVAKGDLYPRLSLAGNLGLAAEDVSDLVERRSLFFGFGPSLRWNLFDAGRIRQLVNAQDARAEQARVRWERQVLVALEETENAMTAFVREQARRGSLAQATGAARRAVELARTQYAEGLSDFQTVLDSQRAVALLEDELAQSEAAITSDVVALFRALGGGWTVAPPAPSR